MVLVIYPSVIVQSNLENKTLLSSVSPRLNKFEQK